jgi:hypothetical protein
MRAAQAAQVMPEMGISIFCAEALGGRVEGERAILCLRDPCIEADAFEGFDGRFLAAWLEVYGGLSDLDLFGFDSGDFSQGVTGPLDAAAAVHAFNHDFNGLHADSLAHYILLGAIARGGLLEFDRGGHMRGWRLKKARWNLRGLIACAKRGPGLGGVDGLAGLADACMLLSSTMRKPL